MRRSASRSVGDRFARGPTSIHVAALRRLRAKLEAAGFGVLRLARLNAVLGLAEIPNALRADRGSGSYHGLQATLRRDPPWWSALKRRWLRLEGGAVATGYSWPPGRTMIALCQRPTEGARYRPCVCGDPDAAT